MKRIKDVTSGQLQNYNTLPYMEKVLSTSKCNGSDGPPIELLNNFSM